MNGQNELVYVALGGAGEIGMNMYLYGFGPAHEREWIIVDCGVTFGDMASSPGVELVMPDIDFIVAERNQLRGVFITHAHEDHIGALARYWPRLKAPVHMTKFTAEIGRRKFEEEGLDPGLITVVAPHQRVTAGAFDCAFFPVAHSVPEAMAVVIRTPLGVVFHTGDFKLDPAPTIEPPVDEEALAALGRDGVLCLACDSTNVFEPGEAGGEDQVREDLARIMREASGAVAATTFASNVARLRTLAEIAQANERAVVVAGRAMRRMIDAALETGAIPDFPETIADVAAEDMPGRQLFYLVTGSQGEGRAALARIASDTHPSVSLGGGDTVIYSSRTIPGNEREVIRVYNKLSERGVRVIDADMAQIHVSGHACREELKRLYGLLKPQISLPLHGEHRHLVEHARMAPEWGAGSSILAPNGALVRIAREGQEAPRAEIADHIETGRVYLDGAVLVGALDGVIRQRLKMARQGHVSIAVVVDEEGELLADSEVRCLGAPEFGEDWPAPLDEMIGEAVDQAIDALPMRERDADTRIEEIATQTCRRLCERRWGKRPEISVMVIRLEADDDE